MRILIASDRPYSDTSTQDEVIRKLKVQLHRATVLRQKMVVRDLTKQLEIQMEWRDFLNAMIY